LLKLSTLDLGITLLNRRIDARLEDLLSCHHRNPEQMTRIRLRDGTLLFVRIHVEQSVVSIQPQPIPPTKLEDALAALDTGDESWRNATDKARRILDKPIPLLIQGESGVGKEYFARAAHNSGPRCNGPFVAINCAALPENLIEAELFGYRAGAFTGARREGYAGRLREAHNGTLFLDEIGDMPLSMQARLLRVLQERQVTPLGGGKSVDVDFSLICATHRKLRDEVDKCSFRNDLYYRINGLTVTLPALRERSDFQVLTDRMLAEIEPDKCISLSPKLLALFDCYPWPGNLRQYANVLRTACAMLEIHENCIERHHLPDDLVEELTEVPLVVTNTLNMPGNLKELSMSAIKKTMEECHGNVSEAARRLGISRQTLYRKLKNH
jgi:transcriptional regulator with PAS, ATPase and Fis domain